MEVVHLKNSDFASGSYRVRRALKIILDEDVRFEPNPELERTRSDRPPNGWFAIFSFETDQIELDLNGHSIKCTQNFVDHHYSKVFAIILLNNSAYGGPKSFSQLFQAIYPGETETVSAHHVIIKNGLIGRSPHFGIKGFYNSYLTFSKLTIEDAEVAPIWLTSYYSLRAYPMTIKGNNHPIRVNNRLTELFFLRKTLRSLVEQGVVGAKAQLIIVEALFNTEREKLSHNNSTYSYNTSYGIILANGFRVPFPTILSPEDLPAVYAVSQSYPPKITHLKQIEIKDFKVKLTNQLILAYGPKPGVEGVVQGRAINAVNFNLFAGIPFEEFFKPGTTQVQLTPFLYAYMFTLNELQNQAQKYVLSPAFLAGVLAPQPVFDTQAVQPYFNTDSANPNRGVFGFSGYAVEGLVAKQVSISNIVNCSPRECPYVPALKLYPELKIPKQSQMVSWGMFLNLINDSKWYDLKIEKIKSNCDSSIGLALPYSSENCFEKLAISEVEGCTESKPIYRYESEGNQFKGYCPYH